jgi:lysophospholipase L1-like esterase
MYVALGSSFAAGPGVTTRAPDSPVLCMRSNDNYAHQLARKRGFDLIDMTCTGATTANILTQAQAGQPRQIDGVAKDAKLVTVTIGGNDISYLGNLWADSCKREPSKVPNAWKQFACKPASTDAIAQATAALSRNMHTVVAAIRERAPAAEIIFIDYMGVLPAHGECQAQAPLSHEELDAARQQATALLQITAEVAETEHVKLVSASKLTAGHDVCAADPWLFGFVLPPTPFDFGPVPYHPTVKAMRVIADAIDASL